MISGLQPRQHTLAGPAICAGVGVHTGDRVRMVIRPAPARTGIAFVRTDVSGIDNRVAVSAEAVIATRLGTVIANGAGTTVSTIEHLMAALCALGVDNAVVELDGPEVPIVDGSAQPFIRLLDQVGLKRQEAPRRFIEVLKPVEVREGGKYAALLPCDRFEVDFEIEFASAAIGRQRVVTIADEAGFRSELAWARTFGFTHEVEALRAAGLARGGSMKNAVVIDGDRVLNPEGLRARDEFVRHKALDAVGDLYVMGGPLLGRFESRCGGHGLNNQLARALMARPDAWRSVATEPELAEAV